MPYRAQELTVPPEFEATCAVRIIKPNGASRAMRINLATPA